MEKSSFYLFELLKVFDELQRYDLKSPVLDTLRNMKAMLLKQQATHRLLLKTFSSKICMEIKFDHFHEAPKAPAVKAMADEKVDLETMSLFNEAIAPEVEISDMSHDDQNWLSNQADNTANPSMITPPSSHASHAETNAIEPILTTSNSFKADVSDLDESKQELKENYRRTSRRKKKTPFFQEQLQMESEESEDLDNPKDLEKALEKEMRKDGDFEVNGEEELSRYKRKKYGMGKIIPTRFFGNCRFCQKRLTLKDSVDHMKLVHPEKTDEYYNCPICGKLAMSIFCHVRRYHNPDRVECDVCKKPFQREETLKIHRKVTHFPDETDFVCSGENGCGCGKRFTTQARLQYHLKASQTLKKHVCHLCGVAYRGKAEHQRHLINVHGLGEKKYSCPQCGKSFATTSNLRDHLITHKPVRNLICTICQKSFYTKTLLKQHEICHKPPQHECRICGKLFLYRNAGLGTHLKQVHGVNFQGNLSVCEKD